MFGTLPIVTCLVCGSHTYMRKWADRVTTGIPFYGTLSFVVFYRRGSHHQGDPFGKMEAHFMTEENIELSRTVRAFAFFRRPEDCVLPDRVIWDVKVPDLPWL